MRHPDLYLCALDRPTISDVLFSCISPATLVRVSRTCQLARFAVQDYRQRAHNINRHLRHFLNDPLGFRELQARTGTVISGSNALQFMDRTFYPEADLDLYVYEHHADEVCRWLLLHAGKGYVLAPGSPGYNREEPEPYDMPSVASIATLIADQKPDGADPIRLKVQVMATRSSPVASILQFHSSASAVSTLHDNTSCLVLLDISDLHPFSFA
jgi:hypothetical protein